MLDFDRFTHLTFDCYGTLIDWEAGILGAIQGVVSRHGLEVPDERILASYSRIEAEVEHGPYRRYREILGTVMAKMASELGFAPLPEDLDALPESLGDWPPFPDTIDSLKRLATRYKLVILSNVDDDLFAKTAARLGDPFHDVITAQQVGSYKPSLENFRFALKRLAIEKDRLLHVAQSLYHDHVPAKAIGLSTVWVNRKSLRPGVGLAPEVSVTPDLEVPDLASLVEAMHLEG
jgi:2-haloacid dehalogenase